MEEESMQMDGSTFLAAHCRRRSSSGGNKRRSLEMNDNLFSADKPFGMGDNSSFSFGGSFGNGSEMDFNAGFNNPLQEVAEEDLSESSHHDPMKDVQKQFAETSLLGFDKSDSSFPDLLEPLKMEDESLRMDASSGQGGVTLGRGA